MKLKLFFIISLLVLSMFYCNNNSNNAATAPAKNGDTVVVHYTLTVEGKKLDSSRDKGQPFQFELGKKMVVPGFDKAVVGMQVNEIKKVTLSPKEGYGEKEDEITQDVPLFAFQGQKPELGKKMKLKTQFGKEIEVTIKEIKGETIAVSMKNPSQLAGKTLNFEIKLLSVNP